MSQQAPLLGKRARGSYEVSRPIISRHRFILAVLLGSVVGFGMAFLSLVSFGNILIMPNDRPTKLAAYSLPLSEEIFNEVRVLCWVLTQPNNTENILAVKRTWGKRCHRLLFMSSEANEELGVVGLPVNEGYDLLWNKTREAFRYVYENHFDEADWFLKADDDTYLVMENLRYLLYPYPPTTPIYFGCKFKSITDEKDIYMSGGAGYVLSREALRRFVIEGLANETLCDTWMIAEDLQMGKCLKNLNVIAGDSRDPENLRGRFFSINPIHLLNPNFSVWWYNLSNFYEYELGPDCCSNSAISFHYISPLEMDLMEYLIYKLSPFGIQPRISSILPSKIILDTDTTTLPIS